MKIFKSKAENQTDPAHELSQGIMITKADYAALCLVRDSLRDDARCSIARYRIVNALLRRLPTPEL